ncbi:Myosin-H heavy chain [Bienertia sinuspersici]
MHMNEDTQHMEQSPSSIHALSESRLQRDLEDSSSESEDFNQGGGRDVCATKAISSRPRRRTVILDWPEHVKFHEKEEAIAFDVDGKRHLVKGPVQPRDVWNDRVLRYYVQFNEFNQPLRKGGCIFVSFHGDVAKRETFCLVGVSSWHKLKKKMKADIVILVRVCVLFLFHFFCLVTCCYATDLCHFDTDNLCTGAPGVAGGRLVYSSRLISREERLLYSSRADQWGGKATEKEKGKFSELDFYKSVYTKKDGSFKEGTLSQQFLDANNKVKEYLASSSSKSKVDIENEVFDDLMYNGRKEGSSYVNHSAIEMENLKAEFSAVKKQYEDLRQKNQALESKFDDKAQSVKAIASHLAHVLKEVRNGNALAHLLDVQIQQ